MTFDPPIPATSTNERDQFLIVAVQGMDCIVIDQDGDIRPVTMTDLKTKWRYDTKEEVWYTTQLEVEDAEGE